MNDFELKRLCNPPLRKQAYGWKDFGRQAVFTGAGAGTGALVNYLLGNKTLSSYLISGGIGAAGGLGMERLLNAGREDSLADEQIEKIEKALGRELTESEKTSIRHTFGGPDYKLGLLGLGGGVLYETGHQIRHGGAAGGLDTNAKKFVEQVPGGEEVLKNLTTSHINNNPNDPLVKQYRATTDKATKKVIEAKIRERVAGANRNYTAWGVLDPVARWANKPTAEGTGFFGKAKSKATTFAKGGIRQYGGSLARIGIPTLIGLLFDNGTYVADSAKTGWLELRRATGM